MMDHLRKVRQVGFIIPPDPLKRDREVVFTHHMPHFMYQSLYMTRGIIYVVRHPIDVAISGAKWVLPQYVDYRTASDEEIEQARAEVIDFFLTYGAHRNMMFTGMGCWRLHVLGWQQFAMQNRIPFLRIKFEDMREDTDGTIRNIAKFLNVPVTDEKVADAVDNCSLEVSREMEEQAIQRKGAWWKSRKNRHAAMERGWRYHGSGKSGYGKDMLTPEQWERARNTFNPVAAKLSYEI